MTIEDVDPRVIKIVDLKTPGSGEVGRNLYDNIPLLLPHDEVKFVICDRQAVSYTHLTLPTNREA